MRYLPLLLLLLPLTSHADQGGDLMAVRAAFNAKKEAPLLEAAKRLQDTPLEPYATYYRLRMHWDDKDTTTIHAYLAREEDTPVIDQFRGEWLKEMAKQKRWDEFASEYPYLINADAELTCHALSWQRSQNEALALRAARKLWFEGEADAVSCDAIFDIAIERGVITEQDVAQRIRVLLEENEVAEAKKLVRYLPKAERLPLAELDEARRNPQRYLGRVKLDNASIGQRKVAMFALQRLARQAVKPASVQWDRLGKHFPPEEQKYFYSWLGYEAARQHESRALEWYAAAGETHLNTQQQAWRVRAALREQNWHAVWEGISSMSVEQQNERSWRYWKARALIELGHRRDAEVILAPLSREYRFYGQMAAEELGAAPAAGIVTAKFVPDEQEVQAVQARPEIQRTVLLYKMGLRTEAAKEWDWAMRGLDDRELLVAAEVARRHEMYDRSINAANRTVELHDFNLRYPSPYREALQAPIDEHGVEEAWVYGLMRQESRFVTHAKSEVGAAGLMQIMPATARWAAHRIGLKGYRKGLIHQLDVNLRLGTYYMKSVYSRFDDNPVLASAAYNAGPTRANRWRGEVPLEGAIYAETIPFDETRDYVKKVMSNTIYYAKLFGHPSESLKQRLGVVATNKTKQAPVHASAM
ncbi:MAG: lytic transglycosylase domain-containing protein [Gammaproteobacteria bacterium]|nr:lytic transglycosylase domain-containing protein [Gammaproteobacteria bacterium]MBU1624463.1 lytic transglycosylase domain-containing protein [Gammaproteobacteria bacterium]MBU1981191.1 lytic transglycosylase domain-containing protein [Gammaproteobacteria bacterium]